MHIPYEVIAVITATTAGMPEVDDVVAIDEFGTDDHTQLYRIDEMTCCITSFMSEYRLIKVNNNAAGLAAHDCRVRIRWASITSNPHAHAANAAFWAAISPSAN